MSYSTPPTKNSGDPAYAASDWNTYIKGNLDELESRKDTSYVQYTSPVTISATVEASSTTIVTAGAVSANGTDTYEIEFFCPSLDVPGNAAGNICRIVLFDNGSTQGWIGSSGTTTASVQWVTPVMCAYRLVPTNGSHTYSVRAFRSNANCTANAGTGTSGVSLAGYIRVRKVQ